MEEGIEPPTVGLWFQNSTIELFRPYFKLFPQKFEWRRVSEVKDYLNQNLKIYFKYLKDKNKE